MFGQKKLEGFTLYSWVYTIPEEELNRYKKLVSDDLRDGGKIFGTTFVKELVLADWESFLKEADAVSTEGKILIKC